MQQILLQIDNTQNYVTKVWRMCGVDWTVVISPIYSQEDLMESVMFPFLKAM